MAVVPSLLMGVREAGGTWYITAPWLSAEVSGSTFEQAYHLALCARKLHLCA